MNYVSKKRIVAVLTFDSGSLIRTKTLFKIIIIKMVNNSLFDGIVLIDVSRSKRKEKNFMM